MIKVFLKDLVKVPGMEAVAIYSINNTLIDSWTAPNFNPKVLEEISLNYFQLYTILDLNVKNYIENVISHEKGSIYARMFPDLLLVAVAKSNVETSLIRFIVNVNIPELLSSRQCQKILKKMGVKTPDFLDKKYLDSSEKDYLKKMGL